MQSKKKKKNQAETELPEEKKSLTAHQTRKRIEDILDKRKFDSLFEI
jgi:hypothetical protein